jgi:PHD/YefM family antitoxin component YafN of YafNO toxin-antitoxin module
MIVVNEQYLVNSKGDKSAVLIPIEEYKRLMDIVEEYEDIKDFDERKGNPEWISIDELKSEIDV